MLDVTSSKYPRKHVHRGSYHCSSPDLALDSLSEAELGPNLRITVVTNLTSIYKLLLK